MKLDIKRLKDLEREGIFLLPCPFLDNSFSVIDKTGARKGRISYTGKGWRAIYKDDDRGERLKLEEALKLLL